MKMILSLGHLRETIRTILIVGVALFLAYEFVLHVGPLFPVEDLKKEACEAAGGTPLAETKYMFTGKVMMPIAIWRCEKDGELIEP